MSGSAQGRIALLFRGDRSQRSAEASTNRRLALVVDALAGVGLGAEAVVFDEEWADEVHERLRGMCGALVWVDPVTADRDRSVLDDLLRDVAASGVWVSAHPDVILKMGTKEVLYRTRSLGWGSDTHLYVTPDEFVSRFPARLATGARVLKQYRGNGGIGVWKVELAGHPTGEPPGADSPVRAQSARMRDGTVEETTLGDLMVRFRRYFEYRDGRLIDQPFQPRIVEGITRCYLVGNEVAGFSRQYPAGRAPAGAVTDDSEPVPLDRVFGLPSAKTMYGPDTHEFQRLRRSMEDEWVPGMQELVDVGTDSLPALWDADFLFGPETPNGEPSYVLSEINVSAVAPFPPQAVPKLADAVASAVRARRPDGR